MKRIVLALICVCYLLTISAQSRLSVGGYGEVALSRNYYSDHVSRYSQPEEHKDDAPVINLLKKKFDYGNS